MRIDKLLWYLRLARSRPAAQAMAEGGHMRLNGRRIDRAHQKVGLGDVLTVPTGNTVQVLKLLTLPARRGPAPEARAHYRVLDGTGADPIGACAIEKFQEGFLQP
ncbi:S4 domain-containing protein [Novosphingobium sp. RD2P27]|uniref:S4 domain-containing protein n=1 Tax=Novosphingobium kalidii TaxID=3230299 RepID=A0ABV2D5E5_9SPHN